MKLICHKRFIFDGIILIFSVGKTANYALVMAQLYTQGTCRGIHGFIVQLRDEETHASMPGMFSQYVTCINNYSVDISFVHGIMIFFSLNNLCTD